MIKTRDKHIRLGQSQKHAMKLGPMQLIMPSKHAMKMGPTHKVQKHQEWVHPNYSDGMSEMISVLTFLRAILFLFLTVGLNKCRNVEVENESENNNNKIAFPISILNSQAQSIKFLLENLKKLTVTTY